MEAALAAEDPRLVSTLTAKTRTRGVASLIRGLLLIAIGMAALLTGLVLKIPAVSIGGFIFALYGGFTAISRGSVRVQSSLAGGGSSNPFERPSTKKSGGNLSDRLQRRWDKRNDN